MPSLATRRRRAVCDDSASSTDSMLEGGGNRGLQQTDRPQDTQAKVLAFQQQNRHQEQLQQRAHLVVFPLFLFGLLAIFSHSLHLSFLSCVLIPVLLGGVVFGGSILVEKIMGRANGSAFSEHGINFIFLLFIFTLVGLAVSQWLFRDRLGPSLL